MSGQFPFGFGPGSGGSGGSGIGGRGGFGEGAPFFRELEKLLSWQGGPINWELARQMAVQARLQREPAARASASRAPSARPAASPTTGSMK